MLQKVSPSCCDSRLRLFFLVAWAVPVQMKNSRAAGIRLGVCLAGGQPALHLAKLEFRVGF